MAWFLRSFMAWDLFCVSLFVMIFFFLRYSEVSIIHDELWVMTDNNDLLHKAGNTSNYAMLLLLFQLNVNITTAKKFCRRKFLIGWNHRSTQQRFSTNTPIDILKHVCMQKFVAVRVWIHFNFYYNLLVDFYNKYNYRMFCLRMRV